MGIPWTINSLATFVSLGGFFWGMDTGLIGPVTVMPQFLEAFPQAKDSTIQGTLVATILMAAALTSATSGSVSDRLSRKKTIMVGAIIGAIGCFVEAGAVKLWMLILGRILAGAGEGLFINTISVYLVEISPPAVRGRTACTLQLLITIGIIVGYFTCYVSISIPSSISFRLPFLIQGICCALLAAGTPLIPHSPRWLAAKGREEEAWSIIAVFDPEGGDRQREKIQDGLQRERQYHDELSRRRANSGPDNKILDSFRQNEHVVAVADAFGKGKKNRTLFGMLLMGLQQLSGIDGVLLYAPVLFAQAGLGSRKASFFASGVSGIVNFVATIASQFWLIDKWGRRPCWILGGLTMGFCMTLIGAMYATGYVKQDAGRWIVISLIYVFVSIFAMTWAVVGKILTTEMQPSLTRATASSLAQTTSWLVNVIVALTTPLFLQKSPSGPYFMFGGFLFVTSVICLLWAPETLGTSLEDIDTIWNERVDKTRRMLQLHSTAGSSHEYLRRHHGDIELSASRTTTL